MRLAKRITTALILGIPVLACQSEPKPGDEPDVCENLAWATQTLAAYRDRGDTREEAVAWANREVTPAPTRLVTLRLISAIYSSDENALALGVRAVHACEIGDQGEARLALTELLGNTPEAVRQK